jgi:hypothetical protein
MEYGSEARVQCPLVYSKYLPHLSSVMSMLHAHGIHAEEVCTARGAQMSLPALMVSVEDYPRARPLQTPLHRR